MTKKELVRTIAKKADVNLHVAEKCLNAFLEAVKESAKKGEEVRLVGFGTFKVIQRKKRKGRNPQTGKEIIIPAKKVVRFYPGKGLAL